MYQRLSEEKKSELRGQYDAVQEYTICYNAIEAVGDQFEDLSPEEVWSEALILVNEIKKAPNRKWKVQTIFNQLKRKYDSFDGVNKRTDQQRTRTATMVLFDVLIMLSLAKKVDAEHLNEHPYYDHMVTILNFIGGTTLFEAMLAVAHQDEDSIEQMVGEELQPHDYLGTRPQQPHNQCLEKPFENTDTRIKKLKLIYAALRKVEEFNGGSQWFYIYKMMAENGIYNEHSYTPFINDLKAIGVNDKSLPATIIFSRKYKQLKEGTQYPYWKVKAGGKQPTLDLGIKFAKIAFQILFS